VGFLLAVVDGADDLVVVLDVVPGERVVEIDARAAADDGLDEPFLAVDADLRPGIPVVFGNLVLAYRPDLLLVECAEGLLGRDDHAPALADLLATDVVLDAPEEVALADDDGPGLELAFVVVDALVLGDFGVRRVDESVVLDRPRGVVEQNEVAVPDAVGLVAVLRAFLGGFRLPRLPVLRLLLLVQFLLDRFDSLGFPLLFLRFLAVGLGFVAHTVLVRRWTLKNTVSACSCHVLTRSPAVPAQ